MSNEILNPVEKGGLRHRLSGSLSGRVVAAAIMAVCMGVLVLAIYIKPEERGLGSHEQLGMAQCGFYERSGYPCPTCGMTTAFAHVVRGQLVRAFVVQPAGALGALACVLAMVVCGYAAITRKGLGKYFFGINWMMVIMIIGGVVLAAWGWLCLLAYYRMGQGG